MGGALAKVTAYPLDLAYTLKAKNYAVGKVRVDIVCCLAALTLYVACAWYMLYILGKYRINIGRSRCCSDAQHNRARKR
jgi:hypothetical protein